MWRTYVICVLIGLLLVSTGGNVLLTRQLLAAQSDADRPRQRLANVPTPGPAPTAPAVPVPTIAASLPDRLLLQQIEDQVAMLRGLQPKGQVPLAGSYDFAVADGSILLPRLNPRSADLLRSRERMDDHASPAALPQGR